MFKLNFLQLIFLVLYIFTIHFNNRSHGAACAQILLYHECLNIYPLIKYQNFAK